MDQFNYRFDDLHIKDKKQAEKDPKPARSGAAKTAYLTFDDGPSEYTPRLLELLSENSVEAAFFVSFRGKDTPEKRKILRRMANEGHSIGIHSWSHDYFSIYENEENFLNDFKKMRSIILEATGVDPKISRFPGGSGNTVSIIASCGRIIMPALFEDVEAMGIKPFDWNAGGEDAEFPFPTSDELIRDILEDAEGKNNLVILLHDTHPFSIDVVPELIRSLRARGYTFGALDSRSPWVRQPFATKKQVLSSLRESLKLLAEFTRLMEST